jgi:hypothetical protein
MGQGNQTSPDLFTGFSGVLYLFQKALKLSNNNDSISGMNIH